MLCVIGDKLLSSRIKNGILVLCPTMDLIALANDDDQVQVFRMNGEQVFGIAKKRPAAQVTRLNWKPNGRLLAAGYSDGNVLLVNTHTGGIVHKIEALASEETSIKCLEWGLSLSNPSAAKSRINSSVNGITLETLIDHGFQGSTLDLPPDLPAELAGLDVEALLPKMSPLPVLNRDEGIFSLRSSLDSLFHASRKEDQESTDTLIIGVANGRLVLNVYDNFSLGHISNKNQDLVLENHASHPYSSTQALLWRSSSGQQVYFQPIDIRPITDTGRYLSLIASKTTQIQNLLRYLDLTQQHISTEFKNSHDLPKKFMRNVEESLQEHDHCSFIDAVYHLAATGHCYDTMKEWLVDELGERGQKRWEKATTTGYENVRQYTHENLIPGLQRFSVLMSRLRGLSRFQESNVALGLETQELDQIFDTLNCLELLAHCILIYTNQELQQFQSFSTWLKSEIETQAINPMSAAADEHLERDIIPDYPKILDYVQGPMLNSRLYELLDLQINKERPTWDLVDEGSGLYEHYKSEIQKVRNDCVLEKQLPGLERLLAYLKVQCSEVFAKISAAQGRKTRLGDVLHVGDDIDYSDICIWPEDNLSTSQSMNIFVATSQRSPNILITKINLTIINGISSIQSTSYASITLPSGSQVQDIKFADPQTIIILLCSPTKSDLLYIPYQQPPPSSTDSPSKLSFSSFSSTLSNGPNPTLIYSPPIPFPLSSSSPSPSIPKLKSKSKPNPSNTAANNDFSTPRTLAPLIKHTFPSVKQPWKPGKVEVNGRRGRRVLCVLSDDGGRYGLFDVDSWRGGGDEGSSGEGVESDGGVGEVE